MKFQLITFIGLTIFLACGMMEEGGLTSKKTGGDDANPTTTSKSTTGTSPTPTPNAAKCKQTYADLLEPRISAVCSVCHEGNNGEMFFPVKENDVDYNFTSFKNEYITGYGKDMLSMIAFLTGDSHPGKNSVDLNFQNGLKSFDDDCKSLN